jgi:hypothetical protein
MKNEREREHGGPVSGRVHGQEPEGLDALAPEVLRLPGREPMDVRGQSVEDVLDMIRDACQTPIGADADTSVDTGPILESDHRIASESPPHGLVFEDVSEPGGWVIIGCGDENSEHGFILEGKVSPSVPGTSRRGKKAKGRGDGK